MPYDDSREKNIFAFRGYAINGYRDIELGHNRILKRFRLTVMLKLLN